MKVELAALKVVFGLFVFTGATTLIGKLFMGLPLDGIWGSVMVFLAHGLHGRVSGEVGSSAGLSVPL